MMNDYDTDYDEWLQKKSHYYDPPDLTVYNITPNYIPHTIREFGNLLNYNLKTSEDSNKTWLALSLLTLVSASGPTVCLALDYIRKLQNSGKTLSLVLFWEYAARLLKIGLILFYVIPCIACRDFFDITLNLNIGFFHFCLGFAAQFALVFTTVLSFFQESHRSAPESPFLRLLLTPIILIPFIIFLPFCPWLFSNLPPELKLIAYFHPIMGTYLHEPFTRENPNFLVHDMLIYYIPGFLWIITVLSDAYLFRKNYYEEGTKRKFAILFFLNHTLGFLSFMVNFCIAFFLINVPDSMVPSICNLCIPLILDGIYGMNFLLVFLLGSRDEQNHSFGTQSTNLSAK